MFHPKNRPPRNGDEPNLETIIFRVHVNFPGFFSSAVLVKHPFKSPDFFGVSQRSQGRIFVHQCPSIFFPFGDGNPSDHQDDHILEKKSDLNID